VQGQPCDTVPCVGGLTCTSVGYGYKPSLVCSSHVTVGPGEACTGIMGSADGVQRHCRADLVCYNLVCAARSDAGGPCGDPAHVCQEGLHCEAPSGTCRGPGKTGAWCKSTALRDFAATG
jgi:hypothetical protein